MTKERLIITWKNSTDSTKKTHPLQGKQEQEQLRKTRRSVEN